MPVDPKSLCKLTETEEEYFVELSRTIDTHLQSHWSPGKHLLLEMPKLPYRLVQRIVEEYAGVGWIVQDLTGDQEQVTHLKFHQGLETRQDAPTLFEGDYGLLAGKPRENEERGL